MDVDSYICKCKAQLQSLICLIKEIYVYSEIDKAFVDVVGKHLNINPFFILHYFLLPFIFLTFLSLAVHKIHRIKFVTYFNHNPTVNLPNNKTETERKHQSTFHLNCLTNLMITNEKLLRINFAESVNTEPKT